MFLFFQLEDFCFTVSQANNSSLFSLNINHQRCPFIRCHQVFLELTFKVSLDGPWCAIFELSLWGRKLTPFPQFLCSQSGVSQECVLRTGWCLSSPWWVEKQCQVVRLELIHCRLQRWPGQEVPRPEAHASGVNLTFQLTF